MHCSKLSYLPLALAGALAVLPGCGRDGDDDGNSIVETKHTVTSAPNALGPGQRLVPGQSLLSINGQYALNCLATGVNVTRTADGAVLWSSGPAGNTAARCDMQGDGNFVVYADNGTAMWNTGAKGAGARLSLQNDGIAVIFTSAGVEAWSTRPAPARRTLEPGQSLRAGEAISSPNDRYRLTLQGDGNLVLYRMDTNQPVWASNTAGQSVEDCAMQGDGNLVLYSPMRQAVWNAGTAGNPNARLVLRDDGDLVILRTNGTIAWRTNTATPPWSFAFAYAGDGQVGGGAGDSANPLTRRFGRPAGITQTWSGTTFITDADNNDVTYVRPNGLNLRFDINANGSGNLLVNASGDEDGRLGQQPGWETPAGMANEWRQNDTGAGCGGTACSPIGFDGMHYFTPGYVADSELRQDVDVSAWASGIDAGTRRFVFNGLVRSVNRTTPDTTRIVVEYLRANKQPFSPAVQYDSGTVASTTKWTLLTDKRLAPAQTRFIRVRLIAHRAAATGWNATAFDGLSLVAYGSNALNSPHGIVNDDSSTSPSDRLLIADTYNHRVVRQTSSTASFAVVAGTSESPGAGTTRLNCPRGVAKTPNGDIYIADTGNHRVMRVRNGTMSVYAGTGTEGASGDGGPATAAQLNQPTAVAVSANGHLYIADYGNAWVRRVDVNTGIITRFAGPFEVHAAGFSGDGGPPTSAMISRPDGLVIGPDGSLYISSSFHHRVRRVRDNVITTVVGRNTRDGSDSEDPGANDGDGGSALAAGFHYPAGLFVSRTTFDLYVADQQNHRVRIIGCSDRNACNGAETYNDSTGICMAAAPPAIDDNNQCTTDSCDPVTGAVTHAAVPVDDQDPCTADSCSATLGVIHSALPQGTSCNDGDPCTVTDRCLGGSAVCRGAPVKLIEADGNPCTAPACDATTGQVSEVLVASGTPCGSGTACDGAGSCEAAPPTLQVPARDPKRATPFPESVRFLHQSSGGVPPIQTGVAAGAIDDKRVALISGRVLTTSGQPFGNVRVSVADTPALGQTLTRADGKFDLVVNGGGTVTVRVGKPRSFSADRDVAVEWWETKAVDDIVLKQPDTAVTPVALGSGAYQVAASSVSRDEDGDRQAVAVVQPGTQAEIRRPDGTTQSLGTINLRMTEYTVGAAGPAAMPAAIPPTTAYTYAVEVSADEAIDAGADTVEFDPPIAFYVDNYLGFPVGEKVPAGYYDKTKKAWIPSEIGNGLVVGVLAVNAGVADLDADGDGATSQAEMDSIGATQGAPVTLDERRRIGARYAAGKSFWRVPMRHLTPWDCNWPKGPPACEGTICPGPTGTAAGNDPPLCTTTGEGSIIECEAQGLGERVDVAGTPYTLNYRSSREPGYRGGRQIRLELTGDQVHSKLLRIEVLVSIAGQRIFKSYAPAAKLTDTISWDGLDGFGRPVVGSEVAAVTITAVYPALYYSAEQFGAFSVSPGTVIAADRANNLLRYPREAKVELLGLPPRDGWSLGGWTLSAHHFLDVRSNRLFLGDGAVRKIDPTNYVVRRIAGNGSTTMGGEGIRALDAGLDTELGWYPPRMAVAPTGQIYIVDRGHRVVRRIDPDGTIRTVVGIADNTYPCQNGQTPGVGDGLPATQARLYSPTGIALGPDGSLYIADEGTRSVRRVGPDGRIATVAGPSVCPASGSGMPIGSADGPGAIARFSDHLTGIAVAPDGAVLVADYSNARIRKISPDGIVSTFAGNGTTGGSYAERNNRPATSIPLGQPHDVAVGADGTAYIARAYELISVQADGIARILNKPHRNEDVNVDGVHISQQTVDINLRTLAVDRRGRVLYFDDDWQRSTVDGIARTSIRAVDPTGIVTTLSLARHFYTALPPDGAVALQDGPPGIGSIAPGLGDSVLALADNRIYALERPAARGVSACGDATAGFLIPEGDEGYCFDGSGRHLSTLDLRSGQRRLTFSYVNGSLASIANATGQLTTVNATTGAFTVTGPHGQATTLNRAANGYLGSITDAAGGVTFSHRNNGLLDTYTDRRGIAYSFDYDADGYLTSDRGAIGTELDSTQTLASQVIPGGRLVSRYTPLGRLTTYGVVRDPANVVVQTTTEPDGTTTERRRSPNATESVTAADGTVTNVVFGPSARFGMRRPMVTSVSTVLPSGHTRTITQAQSATFSDPNNPMSVLQETTTRSVGGGLPLTILYDAPSRSEATRSPAGRLTTRIRDALGRPSRLHIDGITPIDVAYDGNGRIETVTQGARVTRFGYETDSSDAGYLESVTNALGEVTTFDSDLFGRPKLQTRGGHTTELDWDGNDNLIRVKPPGRPDHIFGYSPFDRLASYDPPALTNVPVVRTTYDQTLDRMRLRETRQSTLAATFAYDPNTNRVDKITHSNGIVDYSYYASTSTATRAAKGRISAITGPLTVNLGFEYDGRLVKAVTWSGGIAGTVSWQHDAVFQPTEEKVAANRLVKLGYDVDGLLTCASPTSCAPPGTDALIINRSPQNRLVTGTTLGNVSEAFTYNEFGEVATQIAKHGSTTLASFTYHTTAAPRDALGRVKELTETIEGTTRVVSYTYDGRGQLTDIKVGGVEAEHIDYDGNGNRSGYRSPGLGTIVPSHDDQDRLRLYGPLQMTYRANGEMASRLDTRIRSSATFTYDDIGNLLSVQLPRSGPLIEYLVDGQGRRVAKKVNGTIVKRWLYRSQLQPVAELDGAGALVAQFVYGTKRNVPDFVVRADGKIYRVISDQLGSPRIVVNVASSSDVPFRATYTAFGETTGTVTGLDWMPFGFAGGLYDPDTKLLRFGARDYDPITGRWLAKDPRRFRGGTNLYAYAANNPANLIDRTGFEPEDPTDLYKDLGEDVVKDLVLKHFPKLTPYYRAYKGVDLAVEILYGLCGSCDVDVPGFTCFCGELEYSGGECDADGRHLPPLESASPDPDPCQMTSSLACECGTMSSPLCGETE